MSSPSEVRGEAPAAFALWSLSKQNMTSHEVSNAEAETKLRKIMTQVDTLRKYSLLYRDERIIHKLRIGHIHLILSYLLCQGSVPVCESCHSAQTVEHLLYVSLYRLQAELKW